MPPDNESVAAPKWAWVLLGAGVAASAALYIGGSPLAESGLAARRLFESTIIAAIAGGAALIRFAFGGFDAHDGQQPAARRWVTAAVLAIVGVLIVPAATSLTFLADDFFELVYVLNSGGKHWLPQPSWHHYFPLGLELMAFPMRVVGWDATWLHVHSIVAVLLLAAATTQLAAQAGVDGPELGLVALLALTFPLNASAIYWIAIIKFTYSAMFAVIAVYAFRWFVRGGSVLGIGVCKIATLASMLCIEQAAAIVPLCWFVAWMDREHLGKHSRRLVIGALMAPAAVVIALLLWKAVAGGSAAYGGMSPVAVLRTMSAYGWSLLTPGSSAGLQLGLVLASRGVAILLASLLVMAGLYLVAMFSGSPARKFGISWALISGIPVVLGAPGVVSRYYAFPAVGVAIALGAWASEAPARQRAARHATLLVAIIAGTWWIVRWSADFRAASDITREVHQGIVENVLPGTPYENIALVDLPSHVGEGDWPATVFATGGRVLVGITRSDYDLETIRAIRVWRTIPESRWGTESEYVSDDVLADAVANPEHVILQWQGGDAGLIRLTPPS